VDRHLNVYVSDFGFARQRENLSSKGFTKNTMGPVKWEAPESLQHKEYRSVRPSAWMVWCGVVSWRLGSAVD